MLKYTNIGESVTIYNDGSTGVLNEKVRVKESLSSVYLSMSLLYNTYEIGISQGLLTK